MRPVCNHQENKKRRKPRGFLGFLARKESELQPNCNLVALLSVGLVPFSNQGYTGTMGIGGAFALLVLLLSSRIETVPRLGGTLAFPFFRLPPSLLQQNEVDERDPVDVNLVLRANGGWSPVKGKLL